MCKVRLGVIGAGVIMESHLAGIAEAGRMSVCAVCDTDEQRLESLRLRLGVPAFTDYWEMLETAPDVVLIATPHHLHAPLAISAIRCGCHVVIEKPMATTVKDCWESRRAGRQGKEETGPRSTVPTPDQQVYQRQHEARRRDHGPDNRDVKQGVPTPS